MCLSEVLPTTAIDTVSGVYTPKRYRQLQVKDLPKVSTWRLARDLNPIDRHRIDLTRVSLNHQVYCMRDQKQPYIKNGSPSSDQ